jgi:glycine cleavage system aminomethyltransferase T
MSAELQLPLSHSPLDGVLRRAGAHMAERDGWLVAADFGSLASELAVSRAAAGLADVSSIPKLELRGSAEAIAALHPALDPCGPVRTGDAWWCLLSPELALVLGVPGTNGAMRGEVESLCAGAEVTVSDVTADRVAICLMGPSAAKVLTRAGARGLPADGIRSESIGGIPTLVLHESDRRWLLVAPVADAAELWHQLSDAGAPLGLAYVGSDALQHLLVARGR